MPTPPKLLTPALLKKTLRKSLHRTDRIAVLGIGSDLRGDDIAGMLVARKLGRLFLTSPSKAAAFEGCTAPENLTGEIIRFIRSGGPNAKGHLVLVDAADLKSKPGALRLVAPQELSGVSFSTHQLPLSVLVDYFRQSLTIEISIIAIQPRNTSFGAGVSPSVTKAVNHVVAAIRSAIPTPHRQRG